jgi:hypothetical protein
MPTVCLQLFLQANFFAISDAACGVCNPVSNFACLSSSQFINCNSTALDYTYVGVCPSPTVCIESLPLARPLVTIPCFQNTTGSNVTFAASCDRTPLTVVVNSPSESPFNAASWCSTRSPGLYPVPSSTDCTHYTRCFKRNNVVTGAIFKCSGTSRFDSTTSLCDVNVDC